MTLSLVLIAVQQKLTAGGPRKLLGSCRSGTSHIGIYKGILQWMDSQEDANPGDATAIWWLNSNPDIWGSWVTEEAGAAIQAALSAGEIADGWPEE